MNFAIEYILHNIHSKLIFCMHHPNSDSFNLLFAMLVIIPFIRDQTLPRLVMDFVLFNNEFVPTILWWFVIVYMPVVFFEKFYNLFVRKVKDIKNKHIVVIDDSSDIGKCMAILAAKKGANVTIITRNVQNLEKAKCEILQACENKDIQKVEYLSLNIGTDYESIEKALADLENVMGPIYMLINCVGLGTAGKTENTTAMNLDEIIRTNLLYTYYCIKAVTPKMKASKEGIIVLMSSQTGLLDIFEYTAYKSTNFALRGLAKSLAMELEPYGITTTMSLQQDIDIRLGYAFEGLSKPAKIKIISHEAKLIQPEVVADETFMNALKGHFFSSIENYREVENVIVVSYGMLWVFLLFIEGDIGFMLLVTTWLTISVASYPKDLILKNPGELKKVK